LRYWLLTYGSLLSRAKAFDTICQKRDVFVILDEPHHAEGGDDPGAWGKAAATAFDRADKILMPTATPWKTPGTPLPFIDYDDEGQAQADYRVHRWQAIEAGWIRPLNFEYLDADVGWQNVESGDSFSSRVSEKGMLGDKALSTAIRKDDYILDALRRGMSQMEHQHRQGLDTTMIVIADDVMKYHAKQVEKVANREWPSEAVRATGDDPNAHTVIDRFRERKSRARILITVGMAGEGCDIPHLGVLVWLTARRTYLFFVQATGRIIRKSSEEPRAHAAVILPNHPDLLEAAAKLKDEEVPPLRKPEKPGERDWTPPEQQTYESWVDNVHVASFADESRDIKVDSKIDRLATAHHVPTSVVYDILQEKVPPPPPERARKTGDAVAMRERINANLKFYAMNNGRDFPGAHNKAKDKAGIGRGRTLESLTNDELDRLLSASEEMREEATP
jgi:superfamily II DNA or RNA helicase